ncbi:GTP-binding protein Era [Roseivivax halodurans JCM 10272]|uniref:GTP-binding protein Era n=1 Tax=Roseivivax halodurans JCM 10272 TaxID=1449350 RepID=X7EKN7_9RHOB|nr:DUF1491 family protein [Roseivivax halodurans]ETX15746.1 GTP-binding protein Era [Roseivivax halodurans JCM 10272]
MAEPRLATALWVSAYRKRLDLAGIPAFVTSRGDETAGAVLVKVAQLDGTARLLTRRYDFMADSTRWEVMADGPEREVDEVVSRERRSDPDLWVIEVEDRAGRHMLGEDGLL